MSTTAIFAEILIVGLQASVWVALLLGTLLDIPAGGPGKLRGWEALATICVLTAAYTLGIVVDRIADTLYGKLRQLWHDRSKERLPAGVSIMRLRVMEKEDGRAKFLDYQRSRLRIARATVLNVGLILPTGLFFLAKRGSEQAIPIYSIALLTLFAASLYAAERIHTAYLNRLTEAYEMLSAGESLGGRAGNPSTSAAEDSVSSQAPRRGRVAAVCHRKSEGSRILLVRTKGDRYWTLPKGHIKRGEDPGDAAAREAREEAGVAGNLDSEPIGVYLYPGGSGTPAEHKDPVTAYLLEVVRDDLPHEKRRRPTWFSPEEARSRLAEGRDPFYAREHARIVDAALERLSSAP